MKTRRQLQRGTALRHRNSTDTERLKARLAEKLAPSVIRVAKRSVREAQRQGSYTTVLNSHRDFYKTLSKRQREQLSYEEYLDVFEHPVILHHLQQTFPGITITHKRHRTTPEHAVTFMRLHWD